MARAGAHCSEINMAIRMSLVAIRGAYTGMLMINIGVEQWKCLVLEAGSYQVRNALSADCIWKEEQSVYMNNGSLPCGAVRPRRSDCVSHEIASP